MWSGGSAWLWKIWNQLAVEVKGITHGLETAKERKSRKQTEMARPSSVVLEGIS